MRRSALGAREASLHEETVATLRAWAPDGFIVEMPTNPAMPLKEFIAANSGVWTELQASERVEGEPIEFVG